MLCDGDYSIYYWRSHNKIIINLPPMMDTVKDSRTTPVDRKEPTDLGLLHLLSIAKRLCEKENKQ